MSATSAMGGDAPDRAAHEVRVIEANGLRFSAYDIGEGPRLALLLHGFPDDAGSMLPLARLLAAAGFRVVAPYTRGYAPTEPHPRGDYTLSALADDAIALVSALGYESALLIGHDWGAATAYAAASRAPHVFPSIVALSVPPLSILAGNLRLDLRQLERSWYIGFFQLPIVPERRIRQSDFAFIERLWGDWSPGWSWPPERLRQVKQTLAAPGTLEAALGYYRCGFRSAPRHLRSVRATQRLARAPIHSRAMVLAGARDGCMGLALYQNAQRAFTNPCRFEVISGVGHFLPLEAPERIAKMVLDWDAEGAT